MSMFLCLTRVGGRKVVINNSRKLLFKLSSETNNGARSTPPFLARITIVGSSVGLASPLFAMGGVAGLWFSYLPKSTFGRIMKYGVAIVIGGGFTSLIVKWVVPFLANNSDFVMPFAAANAIAASFWYSVGEVVYGNAVMAGRMSAQAIEKNVPFNFMKTLMSRFGAFGIPIAGPVIGALTAITAPFLWPACLRLMWTKDTQDMLLGVGENGDTWLSHAYEWILFPVGLPVGILSGAAMHLLLSGAVSGVPGKSWTKSSLPVVITLVGSSAVYFTVFRSNPNDLAWYVRTDPLSGLDRSFNARTGEYLQDHGKKGRIMDFKRVVMKGVTTVLRDPLQAVRLTQYFDGTVNSDDIDTYQPRSTNITFSIRHVHEDEIVHKLIDSLVRQKYLDLQNKQHLSSADVNSTTQPGKQGRKGSKGGDGRDDIDPITSKFTKQCESLGIKPTDVPQIMRELEILVVQQRHSIANDKSTSTANNCGNIHKLIDQLIPQSVLAKYIAEQSGNQALSLLVDNLHLLEAEYMGRLQYVITEEKATALLQKRHQEVFWKDTMFYVTVIGTTAIVIGGIAAVAQSK